MTAQARLIEAYERARWLRRAPSLPDLLTYLMDQHGLSRAAPGNTQSAALNRVFDEVGPAKRDVEYVSAPGWPEVIDSAQAAYPANAALGRGQRPLNARI
jgi:hypothetical protein